MNFVIHWNEKALGSHVFPIPIPPPTSLPTCSLESSFLISLVCMWPVGQLSRGPRQGTDAHQYFCHSMVQSVYDTWVSWGSASRQLTVGHLIFSRWCLQSEGNREAAVTTAGGELWVPEQFPWLKRKLRSWWYPTWKSWKITRRSHKRNTCKSGRISDQSVWTKRRLQEHHVSQWCQNFPISLPSTLFQHSPRNEDPERERGGTLQKWTHWCFLVGPLGLSRGRVKHWIGWIWDGVETWLTWTCETQSDRMYGMVARWCRKWGCSAVWVKTATAGWSQFMLVSAMVSNSVSLRYFMWWNPDSHGCGIHRWGLCEVMEL